MFQPEKGAHLKPADSVFTKTLAQMFPEQEGWPFPWIVSASIVERRVERDGWVS